MNTASDNRRAERIPFEEEVTFVSPRKGTGTSIDLASGGIGIIVDAPFELGEVVQMRLLGGRIIVQGVVRWCEGSESVYRAGFQFSEEDWSILEHIRMLQSEAST